MPILLIDGISSIDSFAMSLHILSLSGLGAGLHSVSVKDQGVPIAFFKRIEDEPDRGIHLSFFFDANISHQIPISVVSQQGARFDPVLLEPLVYNFGEIVLPLVEFSPARIAATRNLRR